MTNFASYEKIPTSFKKLGFDEKELSRLDKVDWVVTEKVHGANFSFVYERGTLKFAKRKEYLSWEDDFFAFQLLVSKIEDKILRVFERLSLEIAAEKYIIYGELCGGAYPNPEVQNNPNIQAIQTGVYYSPEIAFCAFDVAIQTQSHKYYLDYVSATQYFEQENLLYAKPLLLGKLNETLNFDAQISSTIPSVLGLPPLGSNLIEGIVIKPWQEISKLTIRPILKLKNPEFEEGKFHEAKKWSHIPDLSSNTIELSFILEEIRQYINKNRLASAISKVGHLDLNDDARTSAIVIECLKDALIDFNENNLNLLKDLSNEQQAWLKERIKAEIRQLINRA